VRSDGEPSLVEPGDQARLAQVFLAQGREAPLELTGLIVAPREFPQVRQQSDGLAVLRAGSLVPISVPASAQAASWLLASSSKAPLPGRYPLLFAQSLAGSSLRLGLTATLRAELRSRVEQLGRLPPGTDSPSLIRITPQAAQQLHPGPIPLTRPR
jgi:hypothetical protein